MKTLSRTPQDKEEVTRYHHCRQLEEIRKQGLFSYSGFLVGQPIATIHHLWNGSQWNEVNIKHCPFCGNKLISIVKSNLRSEMEEATKEAKGRNETK